MNDVQFKNLLESMQVIFGDGLPLPEQGKDLDLYIDQTHRKFYRKYFGAWNCAADVVLGPLFTTGTMSWDQLLIDPSLGQLMQLRTDAEGNRLIVLLAPAGDRQYVLAVKNGAVFWIDRQQEFLDLLDDQKDIPGGIPGLGDDGKLSDSVLPDDLARLDSPRFTGTPTAPTAGKGTSTDQIATTKFVQNEVADFLSPNQSSFVASQWILDQASSKYYHRIVTDARDISHVYKNEDGGFMVFDDTVEIHVVDEGYIKLVAAAGFDGHIVTLSKRLPVVYSYTPVTDESGQIVSLTLTGIASNPGNITDLDIPSSAEYEGATYPVKKIGHSAFNGSRITSVNIGEGVEEIEAEAFYVTGQLVKVLFPSTLKTIGVGAFYLSGVAEFNLPEGLLTIKRSALDTAKLTSLHIPASVQEIGDPPARTSTALTAITVDSGNLNYTAQDGVLYTKDMKTLVSYPRGKTGATFAIPSGVEELGRMAFYGVAALTGVTLPAGLLTIGEECFLTATGITAIAIPASVQTINGIAFGTMPALTAITVETGNLNYTAQDGVLYTKDMKTLVQYPNGKTGTTFTVPAGVETIGPSAFYSSTLTGVTLPEGMLAIESQAFQGAGVTAASFPTSLSAIADGCYYGCAELAEITFHNPGRWTMDNPFTNCPKLFTVWGYPGSSAEDYAKRYNYLFKSLEEA